MSALPTSVPEPRFPRSYPSGRHEYDGLTVLGHNTSVADLKDAIWWLFFGDGEDPGCHGHGLYLKSIVEDLGQAAPNGSEKAMRDPEEVARIIRNVCREIDRKRDNHARRVEKERAEYERLKAIYE